MDRSNVITLISETYTQDSIGQFVPAEKTREVYCDISSITRQEWMAAGEMGLKPELRVTMYGPDYEGEKIVELDGIRYGIYRTYRGRDESLELYLEKKVGEA